LGERRTCDGCHSPRRGASLNSGEVVNATPAGVANALWSQRQSGETMASMRTRLYANGNPMGDTRDPLTLNADMVYTDVWADAGNTNAKARAPMVVKYTGNTPSTDDLATAVPTNGIINYPTHIAPLWTRDRGANTCVTCHSDSAKLDLRATTAGTGRVTSYEELLIGDPVIDPVTGLPQIEIREGEPEVVRGIPLVDNMAGNAMGMTRSSRLGEILYGENLKSSAEARTTHPNPPGTAPNHATMLSKANCGSSPSDGSGWPVLQQPVRRRHRDHQPAE
jgi:hypothetical protein